MKRFVVTLSVVCLTLVTLACPSSDSAPTYRLRVVTPGGYLYKGVLNNFGQVVQVSDDRAIRIWQDDQWRILPSAEGARYGVPFINNNGAIIAPMYQGSFNHYSIWADGAVTSVVFPRPWHAPESEQLRLTALNDSLQVVGRITRDSLGPYPFRWDVSPGSSQVSFLPGIAYSGDATDINEFGVVIGKMGEWVRATVVRWDSEGQHIVPGLSSVAFDTPLSITDEGTILIGTYQATPADPLYPLVIEDGEGISLGVPGSKEAVAYDINENGWVVGSATMLDYSTRAVLWRPSSNVSSYRSVFLDECVIEDDYGFTLLVAIDINDRNEILARGLGITADDDYIVFLQPASLAHQ